MAMQLPKLDIAAANESIAKHSDSRPSTPESPLWSPPPGTIATKAATAIWSDSDGDSDEGERGNGDWSHERISAVEGIPVPRTGVRRSLFRPRHRGDRSFTFEDAPLYKNDFPLETVMIFLLNRNPSSWLI